MSLTRLIALLAILAPSPAVHGAHAGARFGDDVPAEKVRAAAEALVAARFPEQAEKLEVRVVRVGGSAAGDVPLSVRLADADGLPRGHARVRLVENGSDVGWALLFVAHYDSVAVLRRDASADEAIAADQIGFAWMEVTSFRGSPLTPVELREHLARGGVHAERRLRAGDALRVEDIRLPYAADTGESVVMTYRRGPVLLRLSCQAREPGAVGEVIRIYCPGTQTTYKAQLTAPGKAQWAATL